jgi:transcription-repair coupling factor (superfamily II helicase)
VALGQGAPIPDRDVRIEIPISAYIPAEYVPFEAAKIELHRRISLTQDLEGIATLAEEIGDRFGPLPDGVQALIAVQRLRLRLRALGAGQVSVRSTRIVAGPLSLTSQQLRALRQVHPRAMYESREGIVSVPFSSSVPKERIAAADDMLAAIGTALTAS